MFISEQYNFDWNEAYEEAFYGISCSQVCDCAFTWDML